MRRNPVLLWAHFKHPWEKLVQTAFERRVEHIKYKNDDRITTIQNYTHRWFLFGTINSRKIRKRKNVLVSHVASVMEFFLPFRSRSNISQSTQHSPWRNDGALQADRLKKGTVISIDNALSLSREKSRVEFQNSYDHQLNFELGTLYDGARCDVNTFQKTYDRFITRFRNLGEVNWHRVLCASTSLLKFTHPFHDTASNWLLTVIANRVN